LRGKNDKPKAKLKRFRVTIHSPIRERQINSKSDNNSLPDRNDVREELFCIVM